MGYLRTALAVIAVLLFALSASATTCPTAFPPYGQLFTFAGVNCASGLGGTCGIGQPIAFELSVPSYYGVLESCDVVTWQYGDGTSATMPAGVFTSAHTYATAGSYTVTTSITNSMGTQASLLSQSPLTVANGYLQFNTYSATATEGSNAALTVQRTNGNGPASVHYATSDGSALAGQQYVATSGTLTFADGEIQKTITIPTIDDHVFHLFGLSFGVTLSAPTGGFVLSLNSTASVTITDIDPRPLLSFEAQTYTVLENAGTAAVRVIRSGDLNPVVSVAYSYGNSTATVASGGVLTFFSGETSKTIVIPIIDDNSWEGDRQINASLNSATNGAGFINPGATITVKDNEPEPVLSFQDIAVIEGNSGTSTVTLTATLSVKVGFPISVNPSVIGGTARAGTDYNAPFVFLTIPAGQTTLTYDVQIIGNTKLERDKTFQVSASGYLSYPNLLSVRAATVTILNDDAALTPDHLTMARGGSASITANFGSAPASPQTVTLTSSDPNVVSVPSSVIVTNASSTILLTANSIGDAVITTVLPAAYGGGTFTTAVHVNDGAVLILSPATISVPVGGTATVTASMSPAVNSSETASLKATGNGAITLPDRVTIEAGGTSTFTITGVKKGFVELVATLGASRGNAVTGISVEIDDPPTAPAITQVSPANGPAAGGTNVTINGANLRADCAVSIGGIPAANVAFVSASSMTATTVEHAPGAADVILSCGSDTFNLANGFTFLAASATLSNITPSFGTTAGNTVVKISGTNIGSGCWPFFDGMAARAAIVDGPTEMIAATPAHAAATTVPLMLRCSGVADVSLANAFTYSSAAESSPVITEVDPLVGSAGKSVTISGARFRYDDAVTFDAAPATILSTLPGTHVVRIPELPLGKTSITVTDLGGHSSTTGPIFTIVEPQPPQINGVSPATTRPANEVTLDGSGFRPGYSFTIGDQPALLVSMSYARVVLRVPQLSPGSYAIDVLNSASKVAAVGPQLNVLAAGLAVARVVPVCATTEGGSRLTIIGTGFAAGAVVTFDGVIAPGAIVADALTINVILPPLPAGTPRITVTNADGESASLSNAFNVTSPFDPNGCATRSRPTRH
jgi:hypothetical protein